MKKSYEAASTRALRLRSYSYRTVKNILSAKQDRLSPARLGDVCTGRIKDTQSCSAGAPPCCSYPESLPRRRSLR